MTKKFYRSQKQKMIGGICGGLGEYFEVDVNLIRLIFVAVSLFSVILPMVIFYIVAWAIIPVQEKTEEVSKD